MDFLKKVLIDQGIDSVVGTRGRKKGKLSVKFFDREFAQEDPAYVKFDPARRDDCVTLDVDRRIWALAERGDSYACWVLAHELGHILLHDHHANAFSTDPTKQKLFEGSSQEDFAEWQAITFAGHLLIPTFVAQKFPDQKLLAAATNAPEKLAADRLKAVQDMKKVLNRPYEGDICSRCHNFTLVRDGCTTKCDTCGGVERA